MDEVDCSNVEGDPSATLRDCFSLPLGNHDCLYSEVIYYVGYNCLLMIISFSVKYCIAIVRS